MCATSAGDVEAELVISINFPGTDNFLTGAPTMADRSESCCQNPAGVVTSLRVREAYCALRGPDLKRPARPDMTGATVGQQWTAKQVRLVAC